MPITVAPCHVVIISSTAQVFSVGAQGGSVPLPVSGIRGWLGGVRGIILSSLKEFTTPSRSTDYAVEKIGKWDFLLRVSLQSTSITAKKFKCG